MDIEYSSDNNCVKFANCGTQLRLIMSGYNMSTRVVPLDLDDVLELKNHLENTVIPTLSKNEYKVKEREEASLIEKIDSLNGKLERVREKKGFFRDFFAK